MREPSLRRIPLKIPPLLWSCGALAVTVALLSLRKIHLFTADLGRHLINGREVLQQSHVFDQNFYSYTFPEAPFVNHHWLSGLIFYGVHAIGGFTALSFLHMTMMTLAALLVFVTVARTTSWKDALIAGIAALPLLVSRQEIRPEMFSYAFLSLFLFVLNEWRARRIAPVWLCLLPLLMMVWVNLHIYFVFGLVVILLFLGDAREKTERHELLIILGLSFLATLVNPLTWTVALYPLKIFESYGYMIAENQSVPFFWRRSMLIAGFWSFHGISLSLALGLALLAYHKPPFSRTYVGLAFMGWILALNAIRNFALLGLLAIPALAMIGISLPTPRGKRIWRVWALILSVSITAIDLYGIAPLIKQSFGSGLTQDADEPAEFFKKAGLLGPIFNNYDIGGYLIYHLFPAQKVFVDNRPEAYPEAFFKETYGPMQTDSPTWQRLLNQYQFNTIFFYPGDLTPAAQDFLIQRLDDPLWAPVYATANAIIFARRIPQHHALIERFEIPRDRFRVTRMSQS